MQTNWLNNFKIAIINENIEDIVKCSESIPFFNSVEDMKTAQALMQKAKELVKHEQQKVAHDMTKIQQIKKYLS